MLPPNAIQSFGQEYWQDFIDYPPMVVLECGGRFDFLFQHTESKVFYATRLGVSRRRRTKGLGHSLTGELLGHLSAADVSHVVAIIEEEHVASQKIVASSGFIKGQRDKRVPSQSDWYHCMKKNR